MSVSTLTRRIRALLEASYPSVWVEGEVADLARPASGHVYFSLKDGKAQIRCALFRNWRGHCAVDVREGMQILVRGQVSLYEPRGDFQLIAHYIEEAGEGALRLAFAELKQKLQAEGLFDSELKQDLPAFPRRVGILTSPTGAAIRDIISTFQRRCPLIRLLVLPAEVQGDQAAASIIHMLQAAEQSDCEALIPARGGGSLEDLQAFNEETVARAIAHCPLPVVTGIGHEVDFTIADFVADRRAPTPTGAAEMLSPDGKQLSNRVAEQEHLLQQKMNSRLSRQAQSVDYLSRRLVHPRQRLGEVRRRLEEIEHRSHRALQEICRYFQVKTDHLQQRLNGVSPQVTMIRRRREIDRLQQDLSRAVVSALEHDKSRQRELAQALENLDPQATLQRGYAIIRTVSENAVVCDASTVQRGDYVHADLAKGGLLCRVDQRSPA